MILKGYAGTSSPFVTSQLITLEDVMRFSPRLLFSLWRTRWRSLHRADTALPRPGFAPLPCNDVGVVSKGKECGEESDEGRGLRSHITVHDTSGRLVEEE